jgi:hypothetical protein
MPRSPKPSAATVGGGGRSQTCAWPCDSGRQGVALVESQGRIDARLSHGGSLRDVEREIIDPSPFPNEQKAALWLYASATVRKRTQR